MGSQPCDKEPYAGRTRNATRQRVVYDAGSFKTTGAFWDSTTESASTRRSYKYGVVGSTEGTDR